MGFCIFEKVNNSYLYNVCIREDDTNSPKENVPPPLPIPYPEIYHIVVPNVISYSNTSHFIIVFDDIFYSYESHFLTLPVSTLKHFLSFTTHFNSSVNILMHYTGLVSYTLASIILVSFEYPFSTSAFVFPLVSICSFFDLDSHFLMHGGMPLIPFLVTPRVSTFFS